MAADNLNSANNLASIVATATKESIKKDADKEKWGGIAKLGAGFLGMGAHGALKIKRSTVGSDAQREIKLRGKESKAIEEALPLVKPTAPAISATGETRVGTFAHKNGMNDVTMREQILNPKRCFGATPLSKDEHSFIAHDGLHAKVEAKLHVDNNQIKEAQERRTQQLHNTDRQVGEFVNLGTQMSNSGTEIGLSHLTNEKATEEVVKNLGEAAKQGLQNISRDAADQASSTARQAEASLEVLKKLDSDKLR